MSLSLVFDLLLALLMSISTLGPNLS